MSNPQPDDESPEEWLALAKRKNAIRMLVLGLVILAAGGAWAAVYRNHGIGTSPITYVRVVTILVLGIGGGLAIANGAALARKR